MRFTFTWKLVVAAGISLLPFTSALAQQAYVKLGGGYNFGLESTNYFQTFQNGNYLGSTTLNGYLPLKEVTIKPGQGSTFGATVGFRFNAHIGVEVGMHYLAGAESKAKQKEHAGNPGFGDINFPLVGISGPSTTAIFSTKSQFVLVQPSLILAAGLPKFDPYLRMGVVLTKGNLKNAVSYSYFYDQSLETEDTYYGGTGFGFQGALGLDYKLTNTFIVYAESAFNYLTYVPEKGKLTSYTFDGTDLMPTLNTSQKEINFEEQATSGSNRQQDTSSPSSGPEQRFSLNSIGLQLGLKISF